MTAGPDPGAPSGGGRPPAAAPVDAAPGDAALRDVYETHYAAEGDDARRYGGWRELCAAGKADHVARLARALDGPPLSLVEIGCGDGVLLTQLARRGVAERRDGFDISERAVAYADSRPEVDAARAFDGATLPVAERAYDLAVLSHVLEHVPDPAPLLAEAARVARAVVVEVPLEDNLSAGRAAAARARERIGHLHRLSRADVHALAHTAGLRIAADLSDPLPLAVHAFFADGPAARARATAKWAVRRAAFAASARHAERLFTVHYACLCLPDR